MKIFIESLGCSKNLADSEDMAGLLVSRGHEIVFEEEKADIFLLNTCAFLKAAVEESEREINRLRKLAKKGKKIIVAGCMVERIGKELKRKHKQVFSFVGTNSMSEIAEAIEKKTFLLHKPRKVLNVSPAKMRLTFFHSAYLKIADGCDNRCSYCTIPFIKGPYRSKRTENIIQEAKALAQAQAVEISLIAQDTTSYGIDLYKKPKLPVLLRKLAKIKKLQWIRLMYAYPEKISGELIATIKNENKICDYLDIPIQHISDRILKAMNRKSSSKSIKRTLEKIKKELPKISLRTNFIVGFPGETEKDFNEILKFIQDFRFNHVGVFAYSREKNTKAFDIKNHISEKIKMERMNEIIKIQSRQADKIYSYMKGKNYDVLMDSEKIGRYYGQAPEIDGKILVASSKKLKPGSFVKAKITGHRGNLLLAKTC